MRCCSYKSIRPDEKIVEILFDKDLAKEQRPNDRFMGHQEAPWAALLPVKGGGTMAVFPTMTAHVSDDKVEAKPPERQVTTDPFVMENNWDPCYRVAPRVLFHVKDPVALQHPPSHLLEQH